MKKLLCPDLSGVDALEYNLVRRTNMADSIRRAARVFPDRVAIVDHAGAFTYAELDLCIDRVAHGILAAGLEVGEAVGILAGNNRWFLVVYFACLRIGLVAAPFNTRFGTDTLQSVTRLVGCRLLFAERDLLLQHDGYPDAGVRVVELPVSAQQQINDPRGWEAFSADTGQLSPNVLVQDDDVAQCLFTSGTTGTPKGVLASHTSVLLNALVNAMQMGMRWSDSQARYLSILPLFHTAALNSAVLPTLVTGGMAVLDQGFSVQRFCMLMRDWRATHTVLLPFMYTDLLDSVRESGEQFDSLQKVFYGMAPMGGKTLEDLTVLFPSADILLGSGQTEVLPDTATQWPRHARAKAAAWGMPAPTVETAVLDEGSLECRRGEIGELVYRGPHVCLGYVDEPEQNAQAFQGGWFHGGDLGHLDEESVVWFDGRKKDVIKSGGENVSATHVEAVLSGIPGLREICAIGLPHPRWGEVVSVVLVTNGTRPVDEVLADIEHRSRQQLSSYERPKRYFSISALPRTGSEKIDRLGLKKQLLNTPDDGRKDIKELSSESQA